MAFLPLDNFQSAVYYEIGTGLVTQTASSWSIMQDTTNKLFCIEPTTLSKAWKTAAEIRPALPTSTWVRVGSPQYRIMMLLAYMLNNPS